MPTARVEKKRIPWDQYFLMMAHTILDSLPESLAAIRASRSSSGIMVKPFFNCGLAFVVTDSLLPPTRLPGTQGRPMN